MRWEQGLFVVTSALTAAGLVVDRPGSAALLDALAQARARREVRVLDGSAVTSALSRTHAEIEFHSRGG